jgi:hypothetical protein
MSIWSKVLVVLILLSLLGFFFLGLMTLQVNDNWRSKAVALERDIRKVVEGDGTPNNPSIEQRQAEVRQLETAIHDVLVDRGRVWYNAVPKPDAAKGTAVVQIGSPAPHGIFDKSVLYVFDGRPKQAGGAYLGEFKVTGVDEAAKLVQIEPTMTFLPFQAKRFAESKGPWTLYEVMPGDRPDLLAQSQPAELDALLPAETRKEYAKDGQAAEANDPPERIENGKYVRELRDYGVFFHELDRQLSVMRDEQAANERDLASVRAASADAKKQIQFTAAEIKDLKAEMDHSQVERGKVETLRKAVEAKLTATRATLKKTLDDNKALARQLTQRQLEAADRINRATGVAAQ